ncbi:MAG: hypothetical protein ABMA00_14335 [Gemmatimonas sp.]
MPSTGKRQHPDLLLDGSNNRVVFTQDTQSNGANQQIVVHFPDTGASSLTLEANGVNGITAVNYPQVDDSTNGIWHLVFYEDYTSGGTSGSKIRHAYCTASTGCDAIGEWKFEDVATTTSANLLLRNPYVTTDGNRVFIVYMEDTNSTTTQTYKADYESTCGTASAGWSWAAASSTPRSATSGWSQSLFMGRKPVAANRVDNVFYWDYAEVSSYPTSPSMSDGDLWWSRTTYTDCP